MKLLITDSYNDYTKAQKTNIYGYHGTDITKIEDIKINGLKIGSFFASNEEDVSPYADEVWLRFPFPAKYEARRGVGDYYTTVENIPPQSIEMKTNAWGDYQRI